MANRPIGIDLFAGAGGLSLGFEQAGFDVVAAIEFDPIHCAVHKYNFPHTATICCDIAKIDGAEIRRLAGIGGSPIDVVFGGAPCQGFSLIGKRALNDPRNSLVYHFVRIVKELKPKYFVFENVKGLTIGKHKKFLEEIIEEFECTGYQVEKNYKVLNAAEFGVPQDRHRLFLMGAHKGISMPTYPSPEFMPRAKRINGFDPSLPLGPSVHDAIADLPEPEQFDVLFEQDWVKTKFGKKSRYVKLINAELTASNDYSYTRIYDKSLLTSSLRTSHTMESRKRFKRTKVGEVEPISRFLKLDPNGVCNTLRAGTASDRGAFTSPRPVHPFTPRCITNREAARLHSYPDWFRFHRTKWHGFRQIGNSVPPLLAKAVAEKVIEVLGVKLNKPKRKLSLLDDYLLELDLTSAAKYFGISRGILGTRNSPRKAKIQEKQRTLL